MLNPIPAATIRDDILNSIKDLFGIEPYDCTPITQGYLNLKWKMETDVGSLFVKQYNKTRYPEHLVKGLERSLTHQSNLHKHGIPCPELFSYQGKFVLTTPSQERFVLMSLCDGDVIQPGSANVDQMYTLGKVIGHMHMILNSNHDERPLHWDIRSKDSMYELWNQRWLHANEVKCERTIAALEIQRKIIDEMDLELFSNCERGWAHWDLFVDNILFMPDSVSALLDFDRLNYVYPEFDLSRPILSCTLEHDHLHLDKVDAFVRGYREYHELSTDKLVRSIKLTWWKEAEWVAVETEHDSKPIKRFREENIWVGGNWDNLHDMLSAI